MDDAAHLQRTLLEAEQSLHDLKAQLAQSSTLLAQEQAKSARVDQLERELATEKALRAAAEKANIEEKVKWESRDEETRELLKVVEELEGDKSSLQEQLDSLRNLHATLQTSHSTLESTLQTAQNQSRTTLLRSQSLNFTITSLTASNEFLTSELEVARRDFSNYRTESHESLSKVQGELDAALASERESSMALKALKLAHETLSARHAETVENLRVIREEKETSEVSFVTEVSGMKRLVEAMEKREAVRKSRLEEVESAIEAEREEWRNKEEDLNEALAEEKLRADELDRRVQDLGQALELRSASGPVNGGEHGSPGAAGDVFGMSPSALRAAQGQKKGKSYAEVYTEYVRMQEELAKERSEARRLGECLKQVLGDIEERAPILKEQRLEYERISQQSTRLATQLARSLSETEDATRLAESLKLDLAQTTRQSDIQASQLRDLARQVRTLSRVVGAKEFNLAGDAENDDDETQEEIELRRRADEEGTTDAVVSAHLVTFKSINELQLQNQKLLKITRELGVQMENIETEASERRGRKVELAVSEAHQVIVELRDEVDSRGRKLEAVVKERDMWRSMLQRGETAGDVDGGPANGPSVGTASAHGSSLLEDVQKNFDAYRTEMTIDTERLRDDLAAAQRDAANARTELAKTKATAEFLTERFRLLEENFTLQSGELKQMTRRISDLHQTATKHENTAHKLREEAHELRSVNDQLRHENTNAKSEREVWKSVENRLVEENQALSNERSKLADLMRNLQTLQNEIERSSNESRKRLEEQVAKLDAQAVELKEKLAEETNASRQLSLRKELEAKTYQDRVDKLTTEHQSTREALVVAKTSQEHLEQRVADLLLQVSSREEKLAVYEGRGAAGTVADPSRTREEQLEASIAGLRVELREAKEQLERAKANVQQYKDIAETEGDGLRELSATYETYKLATDGSLAEKETEISSLRERLHSLTTDLTTANTQNSELHRQIETDRTSFEKERKTFEDGLANLRSADQSAREAQLAAQDDLRRQAQLAKEAHDKYERELVAHADDIRRLTEIKEELEAAKGVVREHQSTAEVAVANLTGAEASWTRQKESLEREITDLRNRTSDLNAQNSVLHAQLETFGTQAALLQSRLASLGENDADGATASPEQVEAISASMNSTVDQLREVIRFLRREREVVDLQLEISQQEATRLRQKLESTTKHLEDARTALTEERSKSGDAASLSALNAELLERVHTAQVLRESNQTLRDERDSYVTKVSQLDSRLQQALAELDPLKEQVRSLQAEIGAKQHNIRLLEEDNERWKVRNQSILAKYERIDPEELRVLKEEVEALRTANSAVDGFKAQLAEVEASKVALEAQLVEIKSLLEVEKGQRAQAQERFKSIQKAAREHRDARLALEAQIAASTGATDAAKAELLSQVEQLNEKVARLEAEKIALESRLEGAATSVVDADKSKELEAKITAAEEATANLVTELDTLKVRNARLFEHNVSLVFPLVTIDMELGLTDLLPNRKKEKLIAESKQAAADKVEQDAAVAKLKEDFQSNNAEALKAAVAEQVALAGPPTTASDAAIAEAVQAQVAEKTASLDQEREAAIATAVNAAIAPLQADLAKAREELATRVASAEKTAATDQDREAAIAAAVSAATAQLEKDLAKAREDVTAAATAAAASAVSDAPPAEGTATPADIDAAVKAKLAELDGERAAAQEKAIADAVNAAVSAASTDSKAEIEKLAALVKEAESKNKLLVMRLAAANKKAEAKASTAGSVPSAPAPASALASAPASAPAQTSAATRPAAGAAAPLPPLIAAKGASSTTPTPATAATRGVRGAARGARGIAPTAVRGRGGVSLRGAASARGGKALEGSVLGRLMGEGASAAPKRARDSDEATGDLAKRLKGPDSPSS